MMFPAEAAVYPIDYAPGNSARRRTLRWYANQNLASGYLGARSTSQFLAINAATTDMRLDEPRAEQQEDGRQGLWNVFDGRPCVEPAAGRDSPVQSGQGVDARENGIADFQDCAG